MNDARAHPPWRAVAFAACLPVLILGVAACSDGNEDAFEDQTDRTKDSVQEETNEFAGQVETTLREINRELNQISQRVESVGDDAGMRIQDDLDNLHQRRSGLQTDVDTLLTKKGKEAWKMREELQGRMNGYERDLRAVRLRSIESKEEFAKAARTEIQEIDEQVEQMQQRLSQMDSTRISKYEGTLSEFRGEQEELEINLKDAMSSGSKEFVDARAAMAEVITALRSEVDQAFDDVKSMDRRPKTDGRLLHIGI